MLLIAIIGFIITIVLFSTCVSAHSPSDLKINFDSETKIIDATVTHQVSNPDVHYIYKIEVRINGELYKTFDYTSQPGTTFSYDLDGIEANVNDTIQVKALCNQGGELSRQLTVSEKNGESTGDGDSTPGFEFLVFITALIMVFILLRKKFKHKKM
jgi:hypothetical protein